MYWWCAVRWRQIGALQAQMGASTLAPLRRSTLAMATPLQRCCHRVSLQPWTCGRWFRPPQTAPLMSRDPRQGMVPREPGSLPAQIRQGRSRVVRPGRHRKADLSGWSYFVGPLASIQRRPPPTCTSTPPRSRKGVVGGVVDGAR